ncbi:hypothetical protein BS47DRAFT_1380845 [Hydnum rufescens UP504]|uniref:RNI-like protein n=1 Tax=Hydnum rufescens UP504 TaxID=1448309 RepID=A0A9P6B3G6_9AGAM|nr:hypothetical protein BS47DRAFT_1380845 [Hydnum rufescens UP504]
MSPSDEEDDDERLDDEYEPDVDVQPAKPWAPDISVKSTSPNNTVAKRPSIANFLPHEILVHIFKKLTSKEDQHATLLVSRAWCQCSVELLWHKLSVSNLALLLQMMRIISRKDQTFAYATFIRRLNFSIHSSGMTDEIFIRVAPCVRLERLTLAGCTLLTDASLAVVFSACPALIAVDLNGVSEATDASLTALANTTTRLQGINLTKCKKVTDVGILALVRSSPLLRRIKLHGLIALTDASVCAIAESCPLLLEIDLSNCIKLTDLSVREIWERQKHLREFQLSNVHALTDDAFPAPPPSPTQRLRPNLFSSAPTTEVPPERLPHFSIGKLGKNLHYIHLGHVSNITDRGVTQLTQACPRIRYIDLACCGNLTDLSVLELASLSKLRRVGLVRLSNLTDNAVFALGEKHTALERIHLSYCDNISVAAIHFLLQRLNKLTHLSLTGIPQFGRRDLKTFCRVPPKEFNPHQRLAFCVYSGKGVSELRKYLHGLALRAMDVNHEHNLDDDNDTIMMSGEVEEADSEADDTPAEESIVWPPPLSAVPPTLHGPHPNIRVVGMVPHPLVGRTPLHEIHIALLGSSSPSAASHTSDDSGTVAATSTVHGDIASPDRPHFTETGAPLDVVSGGVVTGPSTGRGSRQTRSTSRHTGTDHRERSSTRHNRRPPGGSSTAAQAHGPIITPSSPSAPPELEGQAGSNARIVTLISGRRTAHASSHPSLPGLTSLARQSRHNGSPRSPPTVPVSGTSVSHAFRDHGRNTSRGHEFSSQEVLPRDIDRELAESLEAALGNSRDADSRGRVPRDRGAADGSRRSGALRNTVTAAEQYANNIFGRGNA